MKKLMLSCAIFLFAPMAIAEQVVDKMPQECIDMEYYDDMEYYGQFEVVRYGQSGAAGRGDIGSTELIRDNFDHETYAATFTDWGVCIELVGGKPMRSIRPMPNPRRVVN